MTFTQAMDYLDTVGKKGSVLGLDTTRELLRRLGNPQGKLKFIHIAGTNGKGSVLAYISTIMTAAGYKTGRYISPAVYTYCEKIQVDGKYISKEETASLVEAVKKVCEEMVSEGFEQPTVFEIETAMSFLHFLDKQCDIVVLETGMGGLDDSTNVIDRPLCSVIMSVAMDHVGIIGNTIEEIAECKAGIIKEDSDVVLYFQDDTIMNIIKDKCKEKKSKLTITEPDKIILNKNNLSGQNFDYKHLKDINIKLLGKHQVLNAITALEVIEVLKQKGYCISEAAVKKGFECTSWSGRFEVISDNPLVIIDGAHNPDGACAFAEAVRQYLEGYTKIFVMGVLKDKDYKTVIELTNNLASAIITINPDNMRALSDVKLQEAVNEIKSNDIPVIAAGRIENGISEAKRLAIEFNQEKTAIVVFGSLSFLGDLRKIFINTDTDIDTVF